MKTRFADPMLVLAFIGCMLSGPLTAGDGPADCTDLSGFAEVPGVDFESRIQPILDACTGCHGPTGAAGLDLRAGESYANLVGVSATTNPDRLRVEPFEPDDSLLMAAINCETTGGPAFRMPGTTPEQRALIRDWIAQGALPVPAPRAVPAWSPAGIALLIGLVLLAARRRPQRRGPPG